MSLSGLADIIIIPIYSLPLAGGMYMTRKRFGLHVFDAGA